MDDIYMGDPRQNSARKKNKIKNSKKRRFGQFFADFLFFPLIVALFLAINFSLFAQSGSYSLFSSNQIINNEAVYVYALILAVSIIANFFISISRPLQNCVAASVVGLFTYALLKQFATFDETAILGVYLGEYITDEFFLSILNTYSHIILSVLAALIFLIFIVAVNRSILFYFIILLALVEGGILLNAYLNPIKHNFRTTNESFMPQKGENSENKRFIYIGLPNLTSYSNIRSFNATTNSPEIKETLNNYLGFFYQNNFTLYQNAFTEERNPFFSLIRTLNPEDLSQPVSNYTSENVVLNGYWNFSSLGGSKIYIKENALYDIFKNNKYSIKVYQSNGIELCSVDNNVIVTKCVKQQTLPINLNETEYGTYQKAALLAKQWLDSTGFKINLSPLNSVIKTFAPQYSLNDFNFSTEGLNVINSFKILDLIAQDINGDTGSNAYFAFIDLPSEMYVYDSMCRLKSPSEWIDSENKDIGKKRLAYLEQTNCLIGQLENFIQKITNSNKLQKSVIVIQGLNNPSILTGVKSTDFYANMRMQKSTTLAIYDPEQKKFERPSDICQSPEIIRNYLYKKEGCTEFNGQNFDDKSLKEITEKYKADEITDKELEDSASAFVKWYRLWAQTNHVEDLLKDTKIEETQAPEESKNVATAPGASEVKNQDPEVKTKPLSEVINNSKETKAEKIKSKEEDKKQTTSKKEKTSSTKSTKKK